LLRFDRRTRKLRALSFPEGKVSSVVVEKKTELEPISSHRHKKNKNGGSPHSFREGDGDPRSGPFGGGRNWKLFVAVNHKVWKWIKKDISPAGGRQRWEGFGKFPEENDWH